MKPFQFNFTSFADREQFAFGIHPDMPLTWVGFGLETGLLWFLGRGVFRFQLSRHPGKTEEMMFAVHPLEIRRGLAWANIVTMKFLHQEGLFPRRLIKPWKQAGENETVFGFDWHEKFQNETLGFLAYGLADMTVDLFKRGAKTVRAQYSVERAEMWTDIELTPKAVNDFMNPHTKDYEPHDTVSCLP